MKLLSTRNIALIALVAVAVLVVGVFVIEKNKEVEVPVPILIPENQEDTPMSSEEFSKYNKVLPEAKITGVKDLEGEYKKVTINNGEITFSFEVPDTWLVETRNSGEVEMNEEELREFLGTKWDWDEGGYFIWEDQYSDYANNPFSVNADYSDISNSYPEVSVSHANYISYANQNLDQIDFSILPESNMEELRNGMLEFENVYFENCLEVGISIDNAYSISCDNRSSPLKFQQVFVPLEKKDRGVMFSVNFDPADSAVKNDTDHLIQTFIVRVNLLEEKEE